MFTVHARIRLRFCLFAVVACHWIPFKRSLLIIITSHFTLIRSFWLLSARSWSAQLLLNIQPSSDQHIVSVNLWRSCHSMVVLIDSEPVFTATFNNKIIVLVYYEVIYVSGVARYMLVNYYSSVWKHSGNCRSTLERYLHGSAQIENFIYLYIKRTHCVNSFSAK